MAFNMGDQFQGLPMDALIGAPLQAACKAQVSLAMATANFIQTVGFFQPPDPNDPTKPSTGPSQVREVEFKFTRPRAPTEAETEAARKAAADGSPAPMNPTEDVTLSVPLLAIVKVPSLAINTVDIVFDMEVKNSERSSEVNDQAGKFAADAKFSAGPFSVNVHVEGSVSSHKENTRETDQSAKYHVEVHAEDKGMPEGLARVLDMMNSAIAPRTVTPSKESVPPDKITGLAQPNLALGRPVVQPDAAPTRGGAVAHGRGHAAEPGTEHDEFVPIVLTGPDGNPHTYYQRRILGA